MAPLLDLYRTMTLIRQTEEQLVRAASAWAHPRRLPYLRRPGGGRRGSLRPFAARRRGLQHASRARARARQGDAARRADGRAVRTSDRLFAWPGRQHAPVRAGNRHDGHQRHRRPVHPPGGRRGLQLQAAQDGSRGGRVLRRRCGQQRRLPRRAEPRGDLEAAGAVRLREQPVRDRGAFRQRRGQPARRVARCRLRHARS